MQGLRPKVMTITTMAASLLPLLWAGGAGAEIMRRVAAPMLGGLVTSAFLTLEVIPVLYTIWRWRQLQQAQCVPVPGAVGRASRMARAGVRPADARTHADPASAVRDLYLVTAGLSLEGDEREPVASDLDRWGLECRTDIG